MFTIVDKIVFREKFSRCVGNVKRQTEHLCYCRDVILVSVRQFDNIWTSARNPCRTPARLNMYQSS
jgi:hypothetical protein